MTCGEVLEGLRKTGSLWKRANSKANAKDAGEKERAALNQIEKEFIALREMGRKLIRETGTLDERNRFAVLKTPRVTRAGRA
jgi:hypothetical protein